MMRRSPIPGAAERNEMSGYRRPHWPSARPESDASGTATRRHVVFRAIGRKDEGVMAIILPHGVLFRGGVEERIRTKLLKDGHIDTVIGLPANLFYSTGIPVCILVLKRCKKPDDVLFINASGPENFTKGKRQNYMTDEHIARIIKTYQERPEKPIERYARRVGMKEIEANDCNLNISRYVSIAQEEQEIDLRAA